MSLPEMPSARENYNIAVVGMAGRVPGARNIEAFWQNLRNGVESITVFTDEELQRAGVPAARWRDPHWVRAYPALQDMEQFDPGFFGLSPRDAAIMDPQHRQFLECAWEALEHAGCDPETYPGAIGVFAGSGRVSYLTYHLLPNRALMNSVGEFLLRHTGNDKDFLATRVSYEFNLKGPSLNVQTACSTSLVAIHLACHSLLMGECDVALAGGVTILLPQDQGYLYREGEVLSPDGHCRAFDANAKGTVFGNGLGVVVLKRLEDALDDGDSVLALIRGSAVNNDGAMKGGYLAPSVDGQAEVVAHALAVAGVEAESISYLEMHGTGTPVGDPIEVTALSQAFRQSTDKKQFCGIGSVKTNIGHVDTAAGVVSFMKAVLALQHRQIPANLHFEAPNPEIDFASSPFYVNAKLREWKAGPTPRRAGINSLGIGGTNAHVIVEEAPELPPSGASRPWQLLVLSAKTASALERATGNLAAHLKGHPEVKLADVAFTLQTGRKRFHHRRLVVCQDTPDALSALEGAGPKRVLTGMAQQTERPVAFLFTGQGAQYVNMGRELYEQEPLFRETVDRCAAALQPHLELDLPTVLYPAPDKAEWAAAQINQTAITQPALFVTEYALAQLWLQWGLRPEAMIGHSIGEYVAACLAGVFSLEEALGLVAARGRLMQAQPAGAMIAVPLSEAELRPCLSSEVALAASNGPGLCVLSGPVAAIAAVEKQLMEKDVVAHRLHTSHAFHSAMMEPMLRPFGDELRKVALRPPQIPFLSNVTGQWITEAEATSPAYWQRHARQTVRFSEGLQVLLQEPERLLIEVGPGRTLSRLTAQHPARAAEQVGLTSLRHPDEQGSDLAFLLQSLGRAWLAGARVDWTGFYAGEQRRRLPLPTYPFEHQRYWIERGELSATDETPDLAKKTDLADWFYQPVWKRSPLALAGNTASRKKSCWLIFEDPAGLGARLGEYLQQCEAPVDVIAVRRGGIFWKMNDRLFVIDAQSQTDYVRLLRHLADAGRLPERIMHLWNADAEKGRGSSQAPESGKEAAGQAQGLLAPPLSSQGETESARVPQASAAAAAWQGRQTVGTDEEVCSFYSLLFLAQALASLGWTHPMQLAVVSQGMQAVADETAPHPLKALLLGPCKVIPRELPNLRCRSIDLKWPQPGSRLESMVLSRLAAEFEAPPHEQVVAYRGASRWVQTYERLRFEAAPETPEAPASASARETEAAASRLAPGAAPRSRSTAASLPALQPDSRLRTGVEGFSPAVKPGGVYLLTGGLGGLGLEVAAYLARTPGVKLVLVGRTGLPRREDWATILASTDPSYKVHRAIKKVQALEAGGAKVMVAAADVSKREELQVVLDAAQQKFGPFNGVIHAAGGLDDCLIQLKSVEGAQRVLAPKVAGVLLLEELLGRSRLDFLALFSSLSAVAGVPGQVDYCAANAFLDAFAHWKTAKDGTWTVAINWGAWQELGMAAETAARSGHPGGSAESGSRHPVLAGRVQTQADEKVFLNELSLQHYWVLSEHKFQGGEAVLPGTTYLEMARAAFQKDSEGGTVELRDVLFIAPLEVKPTESKPLRLRLKSSQEGSEFVVESRSETDWREHARGTVTQGGLTPPKRLSLPEMIRRCNRAEKSFTGPRPETREDLYFYLGPRWNSLKRIHLGTDEAVALLELPEAFQKDLDSFKLHPALLDWATSYALHLVEGYARSELMYIPFSYKRLRLFRPLPRQLYSYARCLEPSNREMPTFNLTLTDAEGNLLVEIEEFTMKGLKSRPGKASPPGEASARRPGLPFNLQAAMAPAEGVEALGRILSRPGMPQVIVSPQPLPAWLEQLNRRSEPAAPAEPTAGAKSAATAGHARPNLPTPYLAPRTELERNLVKVWEEALGLEGIGVEDNFFELGGHSLLLTQTVTRMRKLLPVELSMRKLFAQPTIAALVAELGTAPALAPPAEAPKLVAVPRDSLRARNPGRL